MCLDAICVTLWQRCQPNGEYALLGTQIAQASSIHQGTFERVLELLNYCLSCSLVAGMYAEVRMHDGCGKFVWICAM
jgi:hypothetical protein